MIRRYRVHDDAQCKVATFSICVCRVVHQHLSRDERPERARRIAIEKIASRKIHSQIVRQQRAAQLAEVQAKVRSTVVQLGDAPARRDKGFS